MTFEVWRDGAYHEIAGEVPSHEHGLAYEDYHGSDSPDSP